MSQKGSIMHVTLNTDHLAAAIRQEYDALRDREVPTAGAVALESLVLSIVTLFSNDLEFNGRNFHLRALGHLDVYLGDLLEGGLTPSSLDDATTLDAIAFLARSHGDCGSDFIGDVCNLVAATGRKVSSD